ncbi:MAG TPA: HAD family hydrolase, partial [Tepidisphaeraceae bacterium]|nr:HAD family hydrolase [Tepidisphaeraceae bacterium]
MHLAALLFDMDGTLTQPMLNFPAIKAEMGIGDRPILEAMAEMDASQLQQAEEILHRHEELAADESTLNVGCEELLHWIGEKRIPIALITRNSKRSVDVVLARHQLKMDLLITRDDGVFKPDPKPLLIACDALNIQPSDAWMIGDGQYDVEAGLAAGCKTIWISHGNERQFEAQPWRTVRDLPQLHNLLR